MKRLTTTTYRMKVWTKENYFKILEKIKIWLPRPGTSGANVSLSAADFKILSLAIFNVSKRLDKLEEKSSATGKGPGKRPSQEHQNAIPSKECSSSSSEQNTSDNDDVQTLMAKVASDDDDLGTGDEDETLTELQK